MNIVSFLQQFIACVQNLALNFFLGKSFTPLFPFRSAKSSCKAFRMRENESTYAWRTGIPMGKKVGSLLE